MFVAEDWDTIERAVVATAVREMAHGAVLPSEPESVEWVVTERLPMTLRMRITWKR